MTTEPKVYVTPSQPTYTTHKYRIEISDVSLLTDGVGCCSSAFIQFLPGCPHRVVRDIIKFMDKGYFRLKTAKIGEAKQ